MINRFPSQSHLWNTASMPRKKVISVLNCDWWRKVDLFWKPKWRKSWLCSAKPVLQHQDQIASAEKSCCVFGGTTAVLFIINLWNLAKPLTHNAIIKKWSIWIMHWSKSDQNGPNDIQSDFVMRLCPVSHIKTSERHLEIAWMGHPFAPAVILWPGGIWLSPLLINRIRACRAVLQQFWRSVKMPQRIFCRKAKTVFLARYL